jgi:2'-5' RNA ligase
MTDPTIKKLRAKEAQIKKRIREIQSRGKSNERKERTARLIRWGIVVEALFKSGEMGAAEWVDACKRMLKSGRDFEIATAEILSSLPNEAHLPVSPTEKQCAPAAGENSQS